MRDMKLKSSTFCLLNSTVCESVALHTYSLQWRCMTGSLYQWQSIHKNKTSAVRKVFSLLTEIYCTISCCWHAYSAAIQVIQEKKSERKQKKKKKIASVIWCARITRILAMHYYNTALLRQIEKTWGSGKQSSVSLSCPQMKENSKAELRQEHHLFVHDVIHQPGWHRITGMRLENVLKKGLIPFLLTFPQILHYLLN